MKHSTGKKALLFFVAILAVFLVSIAASALVFLKHQNNINNTSVYNMVRVRINPTLNYIEENYSLIKSYDSFYNGIEPQLDNMGATLKIVDLMGNVIFDNKIKYSHEKINLKQFLHYDASFQKQNAGHFRISFPVIVSTAHIADAIFIMPNNQLLDDKNGIGIWQMYWPILIGTVICIVILMRMFFFISVGIIRPVKDLNMAASEVRKGNYRFNLECRADNEIGDLTQAFDMMGKELEQSVITQDKLEKERKELIANISHDIKTPIASIKAYSEALRDGVAEHPETAQKYIDVILEKANSLNKLVGDLFEHALQDLGNLRINLQDCYSRELLKGIIEPLDIQLVGQAYGLEIDGELPNVLIKADAMRLEQVIANIVQNAVKYTQAGQLRFKAQIEDGCLLVSISDNGRGIPPEEIPFIFDRFYRGEQARNSRAEGAGLGLSICKYIIEQHGGSIFVQSTGDKGTTFCFTIPKL